MKDSLPNARYTKDWAQVLSGSGLEIAAYGYQGKLMGVGRFHLGLCGKRMIRLW
jgi:hypothetical protein